MAAAIGKWPDARSVAERLLGRFYDHVPAPPEDLFRWIETPHDGRVELWRPIPAGKFLMGSPDKEEGRDPDEGPQHEVVMKSPFRMAAVPVTVEQHAAFDPEHHPPSDRPQHPIASVTWYQAFAFCRWLSATLPGLRLPTEEEWEYACRAGTQTRYWSGDKETDLERVGWYRKNSGGHTHRVGGKEPNAWGLYDIHGNVREWTLSDWRNDYSDRGADVKVDPSTVDEEQFAERAADLADALRAGRVARGGGFGNEARDVRAAYRRGWGPKVAGPDRGFRLCLPAPSE